MSPKSAPKVPFEISNEKSRFSEAEISDFLRHRAVGMYDLYTIGTAADLISAGPRVFVKINDTPYSFLIDTGSPINAIDEQLFNSLKPKPSLKPVNLNFYGYTADQPIEMLGQFVTKI